MSNPLRLVANEANRTMSRMFPGFFPSGYGQDPKHNIYQDFGYPETLSFSDFFRTYTRNGIARAGVDKTIAKTWQDFPYLLEKVRDGSQRGKSQETNLESDIRVRFGDLRVWQLLAETDRRSMVGAYAGVILRFADNKKFDQPVDHVPGGILGLVEIIPAWEGQLTVADWDTDEASANYGQPTMYQFIESSVDPSKKQQRQFQLHPDRVVIWSKDGSVNGRSFLEPGYNDLLTMEKISGAGGEGFWKNAKSAPVLELAKDTQLTLPAGMTQEQYADAMNEQVEDWQKGFDKLLMLQGMQAKTLGVTLPSPEHFFAIALQSFAASINTPTKILVGMQTGERASTEDAQEWAQTCMSRRTGQTIPNILLLVKRLEQVGIVPERDWWLDWSDLQDPSPDERLSRVERMATVNDKMKTGNELIFTPEEMRGEYGFEPLSDAEKFRDDDVDPDEGGALPPADE